MNIYEKAIEVLHERGWTQGRFEDNRGRVCLGGAVRVACHGHAHFAIGCAGDCRDVRDRLAQHLGGQETTELAVTYFNDHGARTVEDVLLPLKELAAEAGD